MGRTNVSNKELKVQLSDDESDNDNGKYEEAETSEAETESDESSRDDDVHHNKDDLKNIDKRMGTQVVSGIRFNKAGMSLYNRLVGGEPLNGWACSGKDVRARVGELEASVRNDATWKASEQKDNLGVAQLVERLMLKDEDQMAVLNCSKIFSDQLDERGIPKEVHDNAQCIVTNKRIFFVDYNLSKQSLLLETEGDKASGVKRIFDVVHEIRDDMWYYPVPLRNLTGINISLIQSSKQQKQLVQTKGSLLWVFIVLFLAFLGLGLRADITTDWGNFRSTVQGSTFLKNGMPFYIVSLLWLILGGLVKDVLNKYTVHTFYPEFGNSRLIILGCVDPIRQQKAAWNLQIADEYPLRDALKFVKQLQACAPQICSGLHKDE